VSLPDVERKLGRPVEPAEFVRADEALACERAKWRTRNARRKAAEKRALQVLLDRTLAELKALGA